MPGDTAWGKAQPRPTEPQDPNDLNPTFILSPYLVRTVSQSFEDTGKTQVG